MIGLPPVACRWRMCGFKLPMARNSSAGMRKNAATSAVLLWCHGNAGNMTHRLENLRACIAWDCRYSCSTIEATEKPGRPSEEGLYRDALAAYDYLTNVRRVRPERLVIFGRSLGGAVAGELATQRPAMWAVTGSCFPSIEAVARHHYLGLPSIWLLGATFRLEDRLPASPCQVIRAR